MLADHTTLAQFLIEQRRRHPRASGDLNALILDVASACKAIAHEVAVGALGDVLDRVLGEFILTRSDIRIPDAASEFAINASNQRFWEPAVQCYVDECLAGRAGPRRKDFTMRWVQHDSPLYATRGLFRAATR